MKISLDWLGDFIDLREKDPQEVARRVTAGVSEIDAVEVQGGLLKDCVVGQILSVRRHPNADRLSVCAVKTDRNAQQIVCGGTNLREGMRVAVAKVGAVVRHGDDTVTINKAVIRGEESDGMICASEELDLTERFPPRADQGARAIMDLGDGEDGVGTPLAEFLDLQDVVLHVDNHAITHRPDLFSHAGFAREFVALGLGTWKKKKAAKALKFGKDKLPFRCIVDCRDLVPRYVACCIEIDGPGETPAWMKRRLEATGWRTVSLPVDITNYVATETGMPLHSFDADDIRGDVHMRTAKAGETITTLDGVERKLPEGAIILSDDAGVFDLLGIMGGLRSSTKDTTRRIYLHAAIADPVAIRKTVIATGHRTDAATVYEKGIPREAALRGLTRAVELFCQLVPGARIVSVLEEWGDEGKAKPITLPIDRVNSVLGVEIPLKKIKDILASLEFETAAGKSGTLIVTPPLHRLGDIRGAHDLIEEIGRVAGYDGIEAVMPMTNVRLPARDQRMHRLRDALSAEGFTEILPVSLVGASLLKKAGMDPGIALEIRNPIGEELSLMHTSTLPSLLEHAQRNLLNTGSRLKTFHWGHVFSRGAPEHGELSLLLAEISPRDDGDNLLEEPFLLLKRHLGNALEALGFTLETGHAGTAPAYAHPGRYAELHLARRGMSADAAAHPLATVGRLFEIHPDVRERFDLRHRAAAAMVDLTALLALVSPATVPSPVPQFPAVTYDVTLPLSHREQSADLLRTLRGADALLESVEIVDLYSGKPHPKGEFSLTLRFTYRSAGKTLTEEEARPVHEKILKSVQS